jgi:hypothetical protein
MPIPWIAQLLIGLALAFVSYLLAPKPKQPKPPAAKDLESPTAEAGRPIPVVFGSVTVSSLNNLGYWDKETIRRDVPTGEGGKK